MYGFDEYFIDQIEILANQESCMINGGHITKYFKLEQGTGQGNPVSANLFIPVLEVFFIMKKTKIYTV